MSILTLAGALAMFLYGMDMMSTGLQKSAGNGLRRLLGKMTSNPFKGVLTGLTNISKIVSFKETKDGKRQPCDGELWYRGYNVRDLVGLLAGPGKRFGFERTAYLLLFGELPNEEQETDFFRHLVTPMHQ